MATTKTSNNGRIISYENQETHPARGRIPPFYGFAWRDWSRNDTICLPIPFNLIAAFARRIWVFVVCGWRSVEIDARDAYVQGRRDRLLWRPIGDDTPSGISLLLWRRTCGDNPSAEVPVIGQISSYDPDRWWNGKTGTYQDICHVTHWMPLPKGPSKV